MTINQHDFTTSQVISVFAVKKPANRPFIKLNQARCRQNGSREVRNQTCVLQTVSFDQKTSFLLCFTVFMFLYILMLFTSDSHFSWLQQCFGLGSLCMPDSAHGLIKKLLIESGVQSRETHRHAECKVTRTGIRDPCCNFLQA